MALSCYHTPSGQHGSTTQQDPHQRSSKEHLRRLERAYVVGVVRSAYPNVRRRRFQNASVNDDLGSIANAEALLLLSGDPASEDDPVRKGTAFQVSRTCCPCGLVDLIPPRTDMVTGLRVPLNFFAFRQGETIHFVLGE